MIVFDAAGRPLKRAMGFLRQLVPDTTCGGGGAQACSYFALQPDEDADGEQATNQRARQTPSPDQPAT
jgi:hypothetical protein